MSGRGKLPVCVVKMRSVLRCMLTPRCSLNRALEADGAIVFDNLFTYQIVKEYALHGFLSSLFFGLTRLINMTLTK